MYQGHKRVDNLEREPFPKIDECLLLCGDAEKALTLLPDESIQTVLTSPPYWSLRDYEVEDQIGRDDSLGSYLERIVRVFDEIKRVLRADGTAWLNVADVYTSGNRRYRAPDRKNRARAMQVRPPTPEGLKPKDLIGVPWRLAFALQDAGWWVRSEVIWYKPNAHPESVFGTAQQKLTKRFFSCRKSRTTITTMRPFKGRAGAVSEPSGICQRSRSSG